MYMISSDDVVLQYLQNRQNVTRKTLLKELNILCNNLAEEDFFSAIDFTFTKDSIASDVIQRSLRSFVASGVIVEHSSERSYRMTEFGNRVSDHLLKSFREKQNAAWDAYTRVYAKIT